MSDDSIPRYLVFLSYVGPQAPLVASVAEELEAQRLAAFAAHRDIPHGEEWLPYIEGALQTCHALAAFLFPGFRESEWTDQEVGYALGQGKRVVSLLHSANVTPHGFLNPTQGPNIGGMKGPEIAGVIVDALLRHPEQQQRLILPVVESLEGDRQLQRLRTSVARLKTIGKLPQGAADRARDAARTNSVLRHDRDLRDSLAAIIDAGDAK